MTGLRLRDDAHYVPTDDGIWILSASGQVVMTGRSIFHWVDRLAPYLNGRHTLAELTAALPADRKHMAERVINALCERGVVVQTEDDPGPARALTADEQRLYRHEIGFLGYFGSSGERSFQAYRDSVAVLVGAGQLLAETVRATLCAGSGLLRIAVTDECPTDLSTLADYERSAKQRDPSQRTTRTTTDLAAGDRLADLVTDASIVVYACDRTMHDRTGPDWARALDQACSRVGVPFVSAFLAGDHAWLGPFGPTIGGGLKWTSAWHRLCALDGAVGSGASGNGAHAPHGDRRTDAAATVVANQLIREVVRLLSGTALPTGPTRMTRVDLRSLRAESHRFLPHPFSLAVACPERTDPPTAEAQLRGHKLVDTEEFSSRMTACLQPHLGVLSEVTERDFAQMPLAIAQVRVSDPVLLINPGVPLPVVTGTGLSLPEARRAAVMRGLATYGTLMVDPRRLRIRGDSHGVTGDPAADLASLRAGQWSGLAWGHGLADGRPHALAAEAVFPALRCVQTSYSPPPGAAAGYSWDEAVRGGLIGQCRQLTLTEIGGNRRRFHPIRWDDAALDARGRRYRSMAKVIGQKLRVYNVTGSLRVPTLAFCLDDVTVAYASGFSFGDALRDGLAEVLLFYQAHAEGSADYAPTRVPPIPERGRLSALVACPTWSTEVAATAARLARLGWNAVAVRLDHDPGVTGDVLPHLVNVVVARG